MNDPRARRNFARRGAAALLLALVAGLASCGARTGLSLPEPCQATGLTRPCADACGAGEQLCEAGFWQACVVPSAARSCSNDCGQGTQSCSAGVWSECAVPEATRACANDCGSGSQACIDDQWLDCEVEVAARACSDGCGSGEELCVSGAWQPCEVADVLRPCESVCGAGNETCRNGSWGSCDAPQPKPPKLKATIRDFMASHPDFEEEIMGGGADLGIIESTLGPDDKPVYASHVRTRTTSGKATFDQWYRDDGAVNVSAPLDLQLQLSSEEPGLFVYEDNAFFPIDDQLLGNETYPHNFHFTLEASTVFDYIGGETFSFSGDDDMWVFINRRLAIDLGGQHQSLDASVALDEVAEQIGLVQGQRYALHFFFAERHTVASNFTIRTSIAEVGSCE